MSADHMIVNGVSVYICDSIHPVRIKVALLEYIPICVVF